MRLAGVGRDLGRLAVAGLAALTIVLAVACVPDIQEPEVRFAGARLGNIGLEGGRLYVQLGVVNPNDFALEASALTYDLDLRDPSAPDGGWTEFTEGIFDERTRVPANDSTVVEIPVEFTYRGLGGAARAILETGAVDYRVRGTVHVAEPVRVEIPFEHEGSASFTGSR